MSCAHIFKRHHGVGWYRLVSVVDRCTRCGEERKRPPTEGERQRHLNMLKEHFGIKARERQ